MNKQLTPEQAGYVQRFLMSKIDFANKLIVAVDNTLVSIAEHEIPNPEDAFCAFIEAIGTLNNLKWELETAERMQTQHWDFMGQGNEGNKQKVADVITLIEGRISLMEQLHKSITESIILNGAHKSSKS